MRAAIALTILSVLGIPPDADAQAWREAYDRKEFAKAAALLEPLVFDDRLLDPRAPQSETFPNAEATERLATMYLHGVGVPVDRVLACALFFHASRSAMYEHDASLSALYQRLARSKMKVSEMPRPPAGPDPRFDRQREEVCGALSADEEQEAGDLMSCIRFGPDLQAFTLDSGHWVQISRKGILVHYRNADRQHYLTPWPLCGQRFTHARHVRVAPKAAGGRARHFLELFSSMLKRDAMPMRRVPGWQLLEIDGSAVHHLAQHELPNELQSMRGAYPVVSFRALASGDVQWRFGGAALAGVVKALPEEVTQDEFPPIQPGSGRIDVTVVDRFGAPMQGRHGCIEWPRLARSSDEQHRSGDVFRSPGRQVRRGRVAEGAAGFPASRARCLRAGRACRNRLETLCSAEFDEHLLRHRSAAHSRGSCGPLRYRRSSENRTATNVPAIAIGFQPGKDRDGVQDPLDRVLQSRLQNSERSRDPPSRRPPGRWRADRTLRREAVRAAQRRR